MTVLDDDTRLTLVMLAKAQDAVNRIPKDDIVALDFPDFALVCRALRPQSYGSLGERWLCNKLGLTRVTGNKDYDAVDVDGNKYEIKFTIAGKDKVFNIVQIRPAASLDNYLIFGIDSSNVAHVWWLSKQAMAEECEALGAKSAHGRFDPNSTTQELRLSFAEGSTTNINWNRRYRLTVPNTW